jgi:hypothetical protein
MPSLFQYNNQKNQIITEAASREIKRKGNKIE